MRAAYVQQPSQDDPASSVIVGDLSAPRPKPGWVEVEVHAGALNMHDIWMLRGDTPLAKTQSVIGSDAAGISADQEVILYPVLPHPGPGHVVPHGTLVSDLGYGVLAEKTVVPETHLAPKPAHLTWAEAAALPTAWLTAYRMLFTKAQLSPGETVLVQGAGGGVATASAALAAAAGARVFVTSRSPEKAQRAVEAGAAAVLNPGDRVSELVDVVIDSVGAATLKHSLASARVGGRIITCGSSTGFAATINVAHLFARELSLMGSTTGTLQEFRDMLMFVTKHEIRPAVDSVVDLADTAAQVRRMLEGAAFGKLCLSMR